MVDIARPESVIRKKKIKRAAYGVAGLTAILLITVGVSRLRPAAPAVEWGTLWPDTVRRGNMIREVRGTGTLVPEDTRWIPATTAGRVEKILLRSGAIVEPESIIMELSNPELEQQAVEARLQYESAQAQLLNRQSEVESNLLTQRSAVATVESEYSQAELQAQAEASLLKDGLIDNLTARISRSRADNLQNRFTIEQKRLTMSERTLKSQIAVQEAEVNRLRTAYDLRRQQLDKLRVRAGIHGVLQTIGSQTAPVEVGAQVNAGTSVARVADPQKLKAELRIPETQARDVTIGQIASVDTRNGFVKGKVSRIDAAPVNGTLAIDVRLEGELPRGARPDLTVDGTVELERLENVVHMGRPAFGQENSTISVFKVTPDGEGLRTTVQLGKSSVNTIEILKGLNPGDRVILSDMSSYDAHDRVRFSGMPSS
jgi:HlyD family secretion protein